MLMMMLVVYLAPFYASEMGLELAAVGGIFFLARLWDALIDPVVGNLSDLTVSRFGRRKPWIAVGTPLLMIALYLFFSPPEGVSVTYLFTDNTYSVGKSNFWDYDQQLFGVDLPSNVGLTGKGLSGEMELDGDHFVAEGIPLTEFRDSDPTTPYPYQLATVVVYDAGTGLELARTIAVAPVSTEMRCDNCHYDGGIEDIATGRVETNILTLHDLENMDEYPPGHTGPLMNRRPILCAECHASNALGAPGVADLPNLSKAMHDRHKFITSNIRWLVSSWPSSCPDMARRRALARPRVECSSSSVAR